LSSEHLDDGCLLLHIYPYIRPPLVPADYRSPAALNGAVSVNTGVSFTFGHCGFELNQFLFVVFLSCSLRLLIFSPPPPPPSLRVCHTELEVCGGRTLEKLLTAAINRAKKRYNI